ncbi:MAG: MauM/NapG family ferredoxin-type protein [Burkholderiaceae bacterium]
MGKAVIPRRRVVGSAAALLGLSALGVQRLRAERALPRDERAIRPPGAVAESEFLAACVRCGLCVQACPFDTLKLGTAEAHSPVAAGTPYFRARDVPCEMCESIPCRRACPTGALVPTLVDIDDARMGVAWLSSPEGCYSFIGAARCDSCWRACPLQDSAITMQQGLTRLGGRFTPTVDAQVCTGCGLCEKACIALEPAITVKASRDGQPAARRA